MLLFLLTRSRGCESRLAEALGGSLWSLPLRVLVVDDSEIVRRSICQILKSQADIEIVGFHLTWPWKTTLYPAAQFRSERAQSCVACSLRDHIEGIEYVGKFGGRRHNA